MNKSLSQKISIVENILSNADSDEYNSLMALSFQHIDEMSSMPPYRMASIFKQKYAEAGRIPSPDMQEFIRTLEQPDINQIFGLFFLFLKKKNIKKEDIIESIQSQIPNFVSLNNAVQMFKDEKFPWEEIKSELIKMIDSSDSSHADKLKKMLPNILLTLFTMIAPIAGEKIIDNIWPDDSTQETQRLLQEQNDLERERIRIDQEILETVKSNSAKNLSGSADASALTQITKENTQFQQAQTDNQMDISEVQLK